MKPEIFISTSNFKRTYNNVLSDIILNLPEEYNNYEISSGHSSSFDDLKLLLEKSEQGYNFLLHNYPFGEKNNLLINLSEFNSEKRQVIIEYLNKMVDFASKLNGDYFSFHGGWIREPKNIENIHEKCMGLFLESCELVNDHAKASGVKLGIENHVVPKGYENAVILYDGQDFNKLFSKIGNDNLFLHLDVAHLKVSSNTFDFDKIEFIRNFQNRICAIHLHDNDGLTDTHITFDESAYFLPLLKNIDNLNYLMLETFDAEHRLNDLIEIIKKYI